MTVFMFLEYTQDPIFKQYGALNARRECRIASKEIIYIIMIIYMRGVHNDIRRNLFRN